MTRPEAPSATGSVVVAAPAATVWAIITDLDAMATITQESVGATWVRGDRAAVGAVFRGRNRHGRRRWTTTCTVVEAEAGRRFGFDVTSVGRLPVARWTYELEPLGPGACRVTESTWDHRPAWFRGPGGLLTGTMDRVSGNTANIAATLRRLRARAEA